MLNFPFFRFPYPNFYYNYYANYAKKNMSSKQSNVSNSYDLSDRKEFYNKTNNKSYKKSSKYNSFFPFGFYNLFSESNFETPIFEIFGIELYLDDIIILCLLFILYKEGVHDEMLFLALILLLLT